MNYVDNRRLLVNSTQISNKIQILLREFVDEDGRPFITKEMVEELKRIGFFDAPAAIKHHGNYTGGLFDHSLEVMKCLVNTTEKMGIKWENPRSPYIVGMFHDLCKADDYMGEIAEETNTYTTETKINWVKNDKKILKGHGDKSIMMLSQYITLTEEEIMCIRFHMGAYETESWDEYDRAIRKYETVLWTHTADMYASKVKNI